MSFLEAARLWLLLGVGALGGAYLILQARRGSYAVRFTNVELLDKVAPKRPGWRRHVPAVLLLLALTSMVVAFAEPVREAEVPRERATVVMAIDTSLSMQAEDISPSRIDGAKQAALEFVQNLPDEINLGLVSFNGVATVRVPPTTDRELVMAAIEDLELDEATAIGDAIFASLQAIETVLPDESGTAPPARIVLMSDGETTAGRPDEQAVEAARREAVPVSTIAFGTQSGVISIPPDPTQIPVPVNEGALQTIADGTGGSFFAAESTAELGAVYDDIGSSVGFETEELPIAEWFIAAAILLALLASTLSLLWFARLP
jgi:Ca-activated chloride channel family protein